MTLIELAPQLAIMGIWIAVIYSDFHPSVPLGVAGTLTHEQNHLSWLTHLWSWCTIEGISQQLEQLLNARCVQSLKLRSNMS
jgi:hypothetical protein